MLLFFLSLAEIMMKICVQHLVPAGVKNLNLNIPSPTERAFGWKEVIPEIFLFTVVLHVGPLVAAIITGRLMSARPATYFLVAKIDTYRIMESPLLSAAVSFRVIIQVWRSFVSHCCYCLLPTLESF